MILKHFISTANGRQFDGQSSTKTTVTLRILFIILTRIRTELWLAREQSAMVLLIRSECSNKDLHYQTRVFLENFDVSPCRRREMRGVVEIEDTSRSS